MISAERHRQIVSIVDDNRSLSVTELAQRFEVTVQTIRRDLEQLELEGLLLRRHGGAVSVHSMHMESSFSDRQIALAEEKTRIAQAALLYIKPSDTILLDSSSTSWQLARVLPDMPLTVITHAVKIVLELINRRNIHVICTGGTLSPPSLSFVGPLSERFVKEYHADKLFLSCTGVDFVHGATVSNEWQATLNAAMMQNAKVRCLLVDHSKFHSRAMARFAGLGEFDLVITDKGVDANTLTQLRELVREVVVADEPFIGAKTRSNKKEKYRT